MGDALRRRLGGEPLIWPPYARTPSRRGLTEREGRHLRTHYGAKLSMIDHWLGRMLDVVDEHDAWDTTAFVLCTDHGHYLGERGMWGKPPVPGAPRARAHPAAGRAGRASAPRTCDALTTTVDLHATLCDVFGVTPEHRTHGHSLAPLLDGHGDDGARVGAAAGVWGREVHVADATRTYARAPVDGEPAAVDVVEPVVDDAGARVPRRSAAPPRPTERRSTTCPAATCR